MRITFAKAFLRKYKKRLRKDARFQAKFEKQMSLVEQGLTHPSLRFHHLKGPRQAQFAVSIENNLRLIFLKTEDEIVLIDLITHDEY